MRLDDDFGVAQLITTADLKTQSKADLAKLAKRMGVSGSASMRKDDLVAALAKVSKKAKSTAGSTTAKSATVAKPSAAKKASTKGAAVTAKSHRKGANGHAAASASSSKKSSTTSVSKVSETIKSGKTIGGTTSDSKRAKSTAQSPGKSARKPAAAESKADLNSPRGGSAIRSKVVSLNSAPAAARSLAGTAPAKPAKHKPAPPPPTDPKILKRIRQLQQQKQTDKDISYRPTLVRPPGAAEPIWEKEPVSDRIALFVRDAHWMHVSWDITRNAIERAKAAMLEQWHGAKPILRLIRMDDTGTTTTSETVERDIEIHGGSRNWYIEWSGEPASFRVLIGYLSPNGRFHIMAKSNIVKTPGVGSPDVVDEHWTDLGGESERIYAISGGYDGELDTGELKEILEDRLHRTLGAPPLAQLGAGADSPFRRRGGFHFDMDVELIVYGSTVPDGYLTLNGEPVKLRSDGSFALRVPFPDRRQVLPAVACSRDGSQQRTIVVAVERNTKIMEPLESEQDTGE